MDLVVLDELGFIPFTITGTQVMFTFCSEFYERLSFIITTNKSFLVWGETFCDHVLATALSNLFTHLEFGCRPNTQAARSLLLQHGTVDAKNGGSRCPLNPPYD